MREVHSEIHQSLRIAVYELSLNQFACCIYTGAFGYYIVEEFTERSGLPPTRLFASIDLAVEHAKAQISTDKLKA
jgi:hypothetical protein